MLTARIELASRGPSAGRLTTKGRCSMVSGWSDASASSQDGMTPWGSEGSPTGLVGDTQDLSATRVERRWPCPRRESPTGHSPADRPPTAVAEGRNTPPGNCIEQNRNSNSRQAHSLSGPFDERSCTEPWAHSTLGSRYPTTHRPRACRGGSRRGAVPGIFLYEPSISIRPAPALPRPIRSTSRPSDGWPRLPPPPPHRRTGTGRWRGAHTLGFRG